MLSPPCAPQSAFSRSAAPILKAIPRTTYSADPKVFESSLVANKSARPPEGMSESQPSFRYDDKKATVLCDALPLGKLRWLGGCVRRVNQLRL
ncbi:hypothetical protein GobsT_73970 [Gemmata obscuriglobus]|nr:hypothetical protein GobsT_73970 [Gemmata obscuriglobus]VTS11898.1 unnamed protein product [Gemmata obscuriglobus UQM 2246]